jgi:opacity protein-like surface antigen
MKKTLLTLVIALAVLSADAQIEKLAGPRVGITMISAGSLASILRKDVGFWDGEIREEWTGSTGKYGAVMSQYGWQWESRFADGGNVTGIVEWIALVGGMEKGFFLPSVSSMVGVRTAKGIEFAVGPNLSLGGISMVIGAGYNFKFGNLNLPVNIVYVPSMNKTYNHDEEIEYEWHEGYYDENNVWIDGYETETLISPEYSITHPTGARVSVMVGFNLSK